MWVKVGNYYKAGQMTGQNVPNLIPGIYNLDANKEGFYLEHTRHKFEFPYKIYGTQDNMIKLIMNAYTGTKTNLGVLFNGIKGTGKSVTLQLLCNKLNLPVIIVSHNYDGLASFIASINQEVIIFIDEYDKVFNDSANLLTVMDGALTNSHRKVFLLSTNNLYINENFKDRPSRIRYIATFENLDGNTVAEITDDILKYPEFRQETLEFIAGLNIITVDIVKAIANEVNIQKSGPEAFKHMFNVTTVENNYNVYEIIPATKTKKGVKPKQSKLVYSNVNVSHGPIIERTPNKLVRGYLYADGDDLGYIDAVTEDGLLVLGNKFYKIVRVPKIHDNLSSYVTNKSLLEED